ncbi:hypothetical protein Tco_0981807 [Tanacetum coccineum]
MSENGNEKVGKRDAVVGIIKESGVHSDLTSRSLMHGSIRIGQLRMDFLRNKIFGAHGIKNIITSLALVQDPISKSLEGPTR